MYPNAASEFRILVQKDGTQRLQVRYISQSAGYLGKWQDVPMVIEDEIEQS